MSVHWSPPDGRATAQRGGASDGGAKGRWGGGEECAPEGPSGEAEGVVGVGADGGRRSVTHGGQMTAATKGPAFRSTPAALDNEPCPSPSVM